MKQCAFLLSALLVGCVWEATPPEPVVYTQPELTEGCVLFEALQYRDPQHRFTCMSCTKQGCSYDGLYTLQHADTQTYCPLFKDPAFPRYLCRRCTKQQCIETDYTIYWSEVVEPVDVPNAFLEPIGCTETCQIDYQTQFAEVPVIPGEEFVHEDLGIALHVPSGYSVEYALGMHKARLLFLHATSQFDIGFGSFPPIPYSDLPSPDADVVLGGRKASRFNISHHGPIEGGTHVDLEAVLYVVQDGELDASHWYWIFFPGDTQISTEEQKILNSFRFIE